MVANRRRFLKTGAAALVAVAGGCVEGGDVSERTPIAQVNKPQSLPGARIISTWNHGREANERAWAVLQGKGSALDAAERGVMAIESDFSNRSVGLGGLPDRDGYTTLDACVQDHDGRCGAVAFLQGIEHPISVARAIMERTPHVMLVGDGAQQWALANGFTKREVNIPEVRTEYEKWLQKAEYRPIANRENHDTIGLLVLTEDGRMAGSCTTSGMAYKIHGRVGDSPIIGAGLFVDGEVGGACATGTGELVIRTAGSHTVVELMRQGVEPEAACREAVKRIARFLPDNAEDQVGFLALRADGQVGAWAIRSGFNYAMRDAKGTQLIDVASERKDA